MRIPAVDAIKGLAIMAVVLIHTGPFFRVEPTKTDWYMLGHAIQQMASFAVPFFFAAAGYFFGRGASSSTVAARWRRYSSRIAVVLIVWILIDGILARHWFEAVLTHQSIAPLWWNLLAIPSFAVNRPDLFFFRGTSVSLWFLFSLLFSISILALMIRLSVNWILILSLGLFGYGLALATSSYSTVGFETFSTLPLEQRGPMIAFGFVALGYAIGAANLQF